MTTEWPGVITASVLHEYDVIRRNELADAAKVYDWDKTLEILRTYPSLINATRLNGKSFYSPLHQAAHGGAPVEVVQTMIEIGAWRTLRNADGERPLDISKRKMHKHLIQVLEPVYKTHIPHETLQQIQDQFHKLIRTRIIYLHAMPEESGLRLPELKPLLEMEQPHAWFSVPMMYGGFNYWLDSAGQDAILISESWCRIFDGSGQRHEISDETCTLVEEGFV